MSGAPLLPVATDAEQVVTNCRMTESPPPSLATMNAPPVVRHTSRCAATVRLLSDTCMPRMKRRTLMRCVLMKSVTTLAEAASFPDPPSVCVTPAKGSYTLPRVLSSPSVTTTILVMSLCERGCRFSSMSSSKNDAQKRVRPLPARQWRAKNVFSSHDKSGKHE